MKVTTVHGNKDHGSVEAGTDRGFKIGPAVNYPPARHRHAEHTFCGCLVWGGSMLSASSDASSWTEQQQNQWRLHRVRQV